jgi:hypothetical protein
MMTDGHRKIITVLDTVSRARSNAETVFLVDQAKLPGGFGGN